MFDITDFKALEARVLYLEKELERVTMLLDRMFFPQSLPLERLIGTPDVHMNYEDDSSDCR